jgi:hypothetical protein
LAEDWSRGAIGWAERPFKTREDFCKPEQLWQICGARLKILLPILLALFLRDAVGLN